MTRFMPEGWALPLLTPYNEAFFTSGRLFLQACAACGAVQHPPEEVCHRCQATRFQTLESRGEGTVHSYVVVHHPPHPALASRVPYAVALVRLDDFPDVRIVGNVLDLPPEKVAIGLRVRVTFEEVQDPRGRTLRLPQWQALE